MISKTAENHPGVFSQLSLISINERTSLAGIFHPRSLTEHHGRRVDTSCLWCDVDHTRTHMLMEKRPSQGVTTTCPDGKEGITRSSRHKATFSDCGIVRIQPAHCASHTQSVEATLLSNSVAAFAAVLSVVTQHSFQCSWFIHHDVLHPPPWLARCSWSSNMRHANAIV